MHARIDDPGTSHEAVPRNITAQMRIVLAAYADGEALMDYEAYERIGMGHSGWTHQRCSDLRHAGFIAPTGKRGLTPSLKKARYSRITPEGLAFLEGRIMRKKNELRVYQQRVIKHLYEHDAAMAVLKMGAGKTAATLSAIEELIDDEVIRHGLIIAPKRVATLVWPDEIKAWEHLAHLEYAVLDSGPMQRLATLLLAGDRQLTIIGIDNVQWLVDEIKDFPDDHPIFDLLVIDETSRLKDPKSKRGKALATLAGRFKNRWGLTGTPTPNSLLDLFTPMKIISNGTLWGKSYYKFRQDRFYPKDFKGYSWTVMPDKRDQILADAASLTVALGEHEMPDLPNLNIIVDEVVLPDDARQTYREMERRLFTEVAGKDVLAASRAIATGKLAQIANGFLYDEDGAEGSHRVHEEKAEWLRDLVADLDGEPTILVYEYLEDLAMIRKLFGDVPYLGAKVLGSEAKQRVEDWNMGKLPLFALHPASGGHGLNLQYGGSRMAWISPTWSAELWDQTIARIHRPGQAVHCMVHVCVAKATVDELKRLRVVSKLSAQQAFEAYLAAQQGVSSAPRWKDGPSAAAAP